MLDGVSKLEPQSNYCPYTTLQFTICCVLAIIFAWSKHATFVLLPFFRCDYTVNGKRTVLFSSASTLGLKKNRTATFNMT